MTATAPERPVAWVSFENNAAVLKRIVGPDNIGGLVLRTADGDEGAKIRERALAFGFKPLKQSTTMRMFFEGRTNLRTSELAKALGGSIIPVSRADLMSEKWTVTLSNRAPAVSTGTPRTDEVTPDPKELRSIGLNRAGEEVLADSKGRYIRRVDADTGRSQFIPETVGEAPSLFLRAGKPEDLTSIASGLVRMAAKGTLHTADFDRVIQAACDEGPHGRLVMRKTDAAEDVRMEMLREIAAIAIDDDASRDRFLSAIRIANATAYVLSRHTEPGAQLIPSPALAAFIRRQSRGHSAVDFRGAEDVKVAIPRVIRDSAPFQIHDLAGVPSDGLSSFTMNILARRDAAGRSILRIPGRAETDDIERLRSEIGVNYALEAVAEIAPAVSEGLQDGNYSTFFFVNERRPQPLDGLPQAALRTYSIQTTEELVSLERDLIRAQGKIRDFHRGVEGELKEAEDSREENVRQKPYQPISRAKEPFTMIPVALEGATRKAQERVIRDMDERGGVDAVVAASLGVSIDELGEVLTAEQVDAVAMRLNAQERGRGFLLADQTGVGKGRSLAAIALAHLRSGPNKKVLYFTESGVINAPDVYRDLKGVGALPHARLKFYTSGTEIVDKRIDAATGLPIDVQLSSESLAERQRVMASEEWPEDCNMIVTTYATLRSKEDEPEAIWLERALDEDTLIILDEAHNALNEKSMQGIAIRKAIAKVGANAGTGNVAFGTATPLRDPTGMSLYKPLMPIIADEARIDALLADMREGGEVAQETFATMLCEDGVMLRRDHDLSNVEYRVSLPDDERLLGYQAIMNSFSPLVELLIETSGMIGEHLNRRAAVAYREARQAGLSAAEARADSNEANQYNISLGSPLSILSRNMMNAIKVDQMVDEVLEEIQEGRKPLITFNSTNSAILHERARGADGLVTEESLAEATGLTLKDQVRRIHDSMYRIKINGEVRDARDTYADVRDHSALIERAIEALPDNLPVSPVDALIEKLEAHGISVGEISGRTLAYRGDRIVRRTPAERNKKAVVDGFNNGAYEVMIYNSAGATGGSYHAAPDVLDQRPRTILEMEAPLDIIKYVQGQGRANRYGQVATPRVKTVMTGLTPEMRVLQQRNKKLRSLGASVDGNRSHPLLMDDVPDLLNRVGDQATKNVLMMMPALARRLGFTQFAESDDTVQAAENDVDHGSGAATAMTDSLSNKVLARSIMLTAHHQEDLVQRIQLEFQALVEELESRNANPLRPKQLAGQVEVVATSLYSGVTSDEGDLDTSAFLSPLYVSTAIHHFNEDAWNGDKLVTEIEKARRLYGVEGFGPYAQRVTQNLPGMLRPFLPDGLTMEQALEDPDRAGPRFKSRHERLTDLAWILENLVPGVGMRFPHATDPDGMITKTVVGLVPPANPSHYDVPSAYRIRLITPGMASPEIMSLSHLLALDQTRIMFRPGLSESFDESYLEEFNRESILTRKMPVQILTGNLLQAISEAAEHDLGTISLYRDMDNHIHRGIVVNPNKVNLDKLPARVSSGEIAGKLLRRILNDGSLADNKTVLRLWGMMESGKGIPAVNEINKAEAYFSITARAAHIELLPLRKKTEHLWRERPGLYEALFGKPLPAPNDVPVRAIRRGENSQHSVKIMLDSEIGVARVCRILELLDVPMNTYGVYRSALNEIQTSNDGAAAPRAAGLQAMSVPATVEAAVTPAEAETETEEDVDLGIDFENTTWS